MLGLNIDTWEKVQEHYNLTDVLVCEICKGVPAKPFSKNSFNICNTYIDLILIYIIIFSK